MFKDEFTNGFVDWLKRVLGDKTIRVEITRK